MLLKKYCNGMICKRLSCIIFVYCIIVNRVIGYLMYENVFKVLEVVW